MEDRKWSNCFTGREFFEFLESKGWANKPIRSWHCRDLLLYFVKDYKVWNNDTMIFNEGATVAEIYEYIKLNGLEDYYVCDFRTPSTMCQYSFNFIDNEVVVI